MKTKNTVSDAHDALEAVLRHFTDPKLFAVNCAANVELAERALRLVQGLQDKPLTPMPDTKVH